MKDSTAQQIISTRIIKTESIDWRSMSFIQSDDFKTWTPEAKQKLKTSVVENNFAQPFYVWYDGRKGDIFCLDGAHRVLILMELAEEGMQVPSKLPATFIKCKNKKEAAKLVLIYSSMYAKVSQTGLFDFMEMYKLDYESMKDQVDLPDFSFDRYEQKFDMAGIGEEQAAFEFNADDKIIVAAGDCFQLNDHKIFCGDFDDRLMTYVIDTPARILLTDPPYNIKINSFLKVTEPHQDFKVGAGEMNDEEFVSFITKVMTRAVDHTVDGSIHYIFMDWRHSWHMTQAAAYIYGSPVPKQLCVWNKDVMANGSFYRSNHELCFIFKSGEAKHLSHLELKDRTRTNVWNYPSPNSMSNPDRAEQRDHPTPKPVAMFADAILDTTNPGDIVLDFFLGSGTTIIAAEQTKRKCYGAELEPKFVQHIIKRYISYCNKNSLKVKFQHANGTLTLNDFI